MKKLLPLMLALVVMICSCNSKRSFLSQKYTHFKHKKTSAVTETRSYANKGSSTSPATTEKTNVTQVVAAQPEVNKQETSYNMTKSPKLVYTRAAVNRVILPAVTKGKEQFTNLLASASRPTTQLTPAKSLNLDQSHAKRGLLWGLIDALLAIILLVVVITLVVWLLLILV